jgi:hypothetical protein
MLNEAPELPRDPDLLIDKIVDLTSMTARMAEEKTALAAESHASHRGHADGTCLRRRSQSKF